jgi:hypothetical protein
VIESSILVLYMDIFSVARQARFPQCRPCDAVCASSSARSTARIVNHRHHSASHMP